MNGFTLYLILRLDGIKGGLTFICACIATYVLIISIIRCCSVCIDADDAKRFKNFFNNTLKIGCTSFILLVLLCSFLPSTKDAVLIYAVPKIMNNEQIQNIGTNSLDLVEESLEYLKNKLVENNGAN